MSRYGAGGTTPDEYGKRGGQDVKRGVANHTPIVTKPGISAGHRQPNNRMEIEMEMLKPALTWPFPSKDKAEDLMAVLEKIAHDASLSALDMASLARTALAKVGAA